jgi:oligoribonuclease
VIVEIATIITDDQLEIVAEGPDLVVHADEVQLSEMDDFVTDMHTKSGLLEQIRLSSIHLEEATQVTLDFIMEHVKKPRSVPLCGNSIGTDRRFLDAYMPEIENFLHYRSIDVSTAKELARRWNPAVLKGVPQKETSHRALDDIRESITELRHYKEHLFNLS